MQLTFILTPEEQREAIHIAGRKRNAARNIGRSILAALFVLVLFVFVAQYAGQTPGWVLVGQLATNPFLWLMVVLGILTAPGKGDTGGWSPLSGAAARTVPMLCQITPEGVSCWQGGNRLCCYSYGAFTEVYRTANLLLVTQRNTILLVLPLRAFTNQQQAAQAEHLLQNGIEAARQGRAPTLALQNGPAFWRFSYAFDPRPAPWAPGRGYGPPALPGRRWRKVFWLLFVTTLSVLGASLFVKPPLALYPLYFIGLVLLAFGLGLARHKAGRLSGADEWLAAYWGGGCTLEIGEEGIRFFNRSYEAFYPWAEVTGARGEDDIAFILSGSGLIAPLPYLAAPFPVVADALDYLQARATNSEQKAA